MILGFAIFAVAWLVPNHYYPWLAFHGDITAALGLALLTLASLTDPRRIEWPSLALCALTAAIVPLIQAGASVISFWGDAWIASLYLMGSAIAILVGRRLVCTHGLPAVGKRLWTAVLFAGIASVGIALSQWQLISLGAWGLDLKEGSRPYGNLAQPNQLSTLLCLGLVGTTALRSMEAMKPSVAAMAMSFLTLGVALTGSRTGWLQVGLVSAWIALSPDQHRPAASRWTALLLPLVLLISMGAVAELGNAMQLSGVRTFEDQARTGTRPVHWASILDAIGRQPLFGYGWNQVAVAQAAVAPAHPPSHELIEHSHNVVLDLLVWNGVPLGLAIVGGIAWWFWRQVRSCRDAQHAALLAAIGVAGVHALLEFPLEYAYFLLPVAVIAGMSDAASRAELRRTWQRWTAFAPALAAALLTVWTLVEYVQVEEETRLRRFEAAGIQGASVAEPLHLVLLTQHAALFEFVRMRAQRGLPKERLDFMRKVAERYGYPPVLLRFAVASGINGQPEQAARTLRRLCRIHPPARCQEGRRAWREAARQQFPELRAIPFPDP